MEIDSKDSSCGNACSQCQLPLPDANLALQLAPTTGVVDFRAARFRPLNPSLFLSKVFNNYLRSTNQHPAHVSAAAAMAILFFAVLTTRIDRRVLLVVMSNFEFIYLVVNVILSLAVEVGSLPANFANVVFSCLRAVAAFVFLSIDAIPVDAIGVNIRCITVLCVAIIEIKLAADMLIVSTVSFPVLDIWGFRLDTRGVYLGAHANLAFFLAKFFISTFLSNGRRALLLKVPITVNGLSIAKSQSQLLAMNGDNNGSEESSSRYSALADGDVDRDSVAISPRPSSRASVQ